MTKFAWWMVYITQTIYMLFGICIREMTQHSLYPFRLAVVSWVLVNLFAMAIEIDVLFGRDPFKIVRKSSREK